MTLERHRVGLVEDDELLGEALRERLEVEGFACDWFKTAPQALTALACKHYDVMISDIRLPEMSGEEFFVRVLESGRAYPPFLFVTGFGTVDAAVRMLKLGAEDYLTKPFDVAALIEKVRCLCCSRRPLDAPGNELGVSPAMRALDAKLRLLACSNGTVLITGESGVGKEHVMRALHHYRNAGAQRPLIAVNCGALTETLLETELFGHEKGAFTGASREKKGVFELARGGTLFLDEIGDMPLSMQVKLLRVLNDHQIVRVGGEQCIPVQFSLVCATHRDLAAMVQAGEFREDLYYRIDVVRLHVPPLRDRKQDIGWLAQRILQEIAVENGGPARQLTSRAHKTLLAYPWPGNIRELKNCLECACIMTRQAMLTEELLFQDKEMPGEQDLDSPDTLNEFLRSCERRYIRAALERHAFRIAETAAALGISRKNLWEKMRKLDLGTPQNGEA